MGRRLTAGSRCRLFYFRKENFRFNLIASFMRNGNVFNRFLWWDGNHTQSTSDLLFHFGELPVVALEFLRTLRLDTFTQAWMSDSNLSMLFDIFQEPFPDELFFGLCHWILPQRSLFGSAFYGCTFYWIALGWGCQSSLLFSYRRYARDGLDTFSYRSKNNYEVSFRNAIGMTQNIPPHSASVFEPISVFDEEFTILSFWQSIRHLRVFDG